VRGLVFWLVVALVVAAALGIGIYYLVAALDSSGSDSDAAAGDVVGLYPVHVGDRWGYIDNAGKIVIQPQFAMADTFSDGLAAVMPASAGGQATTDRATTGAQAFWGFIDRTGRLVIQPQFTDIVPFADGLALVSASGFHGYIDSRGKRVIDLTAYSDARDFSEGLAVVGQLDGDQTYYGYIDKPGKLVIPTEFSDAAPFSEGLAMVCQEGKYGYIDKTGYWVIQPSYEQAGSFSEGLAGVQLESPHGGSEWGYIDKTGKMVIQPQFDSAGEFHEGLAAVSPLQRGSSSPLECGYIDKSGSLVIGMRFNSALEFSGGLAAVHPLDAGWGFIDKTGAFVIEPKYFGGGWSGLDAFTPGGLVAVGLDNSGHLMQPLGAPDPRWAYIDKTGKIVWQSE
jgi:WG containing repeat